MRYIIEIKVRVQNCAKHFEGREEILGEYFDKLSPARREHVLVSSVEELRESLMAEIQKAQG